MRSAKFGKLGMVRLISSTNSAVQFGTAVRGERSARPVCGTLSVLKAGWTQRTSSGSFHEAMSSTGRLRATDRLPDGSLSD
jgi:hypothetical protein